MEVWVSVILGKQGWKFATNEEVMVTKFFKAYYFLKGVSMRACLGHNSSYVWCSIFNYQIVVKLGLKWKIGYGNSIRVWHDLWLKNPSNPMVMSRMIHGQDGLRVCDLTNLEHGCWRTKFIHSLFNTQEANLLCSIPLFHL